MMPFKNNIQEPLVIMRYIPWLPETESLAYVRTHLQARVFKAGLWCLVIIIVMLGLINKGCNGALNGFCRTKKISKGNSKNKHEAANDTGNDHHDISNTHQLILPVKNIQVIKIE